jgi:hypothetical protein
MLFLLIHSIKYLKLQNDQLNCNVSTRSIKLLFKLPDFEVYRIPLFHQNKLGP